jgi:hypothetical protein
MTIDKYNCPVSKRTRQDNLNPPFLNSLNRVIITSKVYSYKSPIDALGN